MIYVFFETFVFYTWVPNILLLSLLLIIAALLFLMIGINYSTKP